MQKQKQAFSHPSGLKRSISGAQKDIGRQSKKIRMMPIGNNAMRLSIGIKKKLSPIIFLLPLISLIPRPLAPKNAKKKGKETI